MNFADVRSPVRANNLRVTQVSSQAKISALCNILAARGDKSPRLPIGVAITANCPVDCIMRLVYSL